MVEGICLLIEPDVPHRLEADAELDIFFVEPSGRAAPPRDLRARIRAARLVVVSNPGRASFWADWIDRPEPRRLDPRIDVAVDAIDDRLREGVVRLDDVRAATGLSAERLRHLFSTEIGMPFRRYVLWRRLRAAVTALQAGEGLTGAAHDAGFADAAHLARTLKAMFGIRAGDAF